MTETNKKIADFEFPPLRPLEDFLLDGARFQIPPYKDLEKWNNRMLSNLLYYQTNYFALLFIVFLLVGMIHPKDVLLGCVSIGLVIALVVFGLSNNQDMVNFKKEHPVMSIVAILAVVYFVVYMLASVVVFAYGVLMPVLVCLIHSSVRLRNLKNKLSQKLESVGFKKTAMGRLLELCGIEVGSIQMLTQF